MGEGRGLREAEADRWCRGAAVASATARRWPVAAGDAVGGEGEGDWARERGELQSRRETGGAMEESYH
nr:hypothetical protein Iba_chr09aCG15900 [Ipomoea batatas]GME10198.1 hypothetical protein Iba_scaffold9691CG0010 [Ipomoea batatas]